MSSRVLPPVPTVAVRVQVERKHPDLPRYLVVPARSLAAWSVSGTTIVEARLAGVPLGRRSLKKWDADRWFLDLPEPLARRAGVDTGATVLLELALAPDVPLPELDALLAAVPEARAAWERRSAPRRRMLREELLAVKSPEARRRRAERALLPPAAATGAAAEPPPSSNPEPPVTVRVEVWTRPFPGRGWGPYADLAVGLQVKAEVVDVFAADAPDPRWATPATFARGADGALRVRGAGVHGPVGERFLYLVWLGSRDGAPRAMFRRAKLRLDAVPVEVLRAARASGILRATLALAGSDGSPVCASVFPPAVTWSAG